jgi:hypothetical protein
MAGPSRQALPMATARKPGIVLDDRQ